MVDYLKKFLCDIKTYLNRIYWKEIYCFKFKVPIQGSGWGWLGYNKQFKRLEITACANQDPLQATTGLVPLFGIDVWEHAYYLQYKNNRAEYVKNIFRIANWRRVEEYFDSVSQ